MTAADLDLRDRSRAFAALEAKTFDILVIGGGVTGAGVARDAALRGLSVALVEARDFASGTSSRSSKMIHGGLRYLAQGDVALVREAALERQVLRRIAPHLARITPFVMPSPSLALTTKMRAGLWSFEKLGLVPQAERHEVWDVKELARREPLVRTAGLVGAVVYPEFLTDDARLTLANVRGAHACGAVVLNYASVEQLLMQDGVAVGALCRGTLEGEDGAARVKAKLVINAAGSWVDAVRALETPSAAPRLALSRGVHVVVPRRRLPVNHTVIIRAPDKRSVFAVPKGEVTYIGTTDAFYDGTDYWPRIDAADVDYLLGAARTALDCPTLFAADVTAAWAGLRPLVGQAGKSAGEVSRKDEVWTGPAGVISIAGGKLSAYRAMAERVVDQAVERLGPPTKPCSTADRPLPGGERPPALTGAMGGLSAGDADRLTGLYGAEAEAVATEVLTHGAAAAEARRAVLAEGAQTLEDYWVRRSGRAWFDIDAGLASLEPAADAMASLLGWTTERRAEETAACRRINRNSRPALADQERSAG